MSEASREVAARMVMAKQTVPHYYLTVDIEVSPLAPLLPHLFAFTYNHFLVILSRAFQLDALLKSRHLLNSALGSDSSIGAHEMLLKAAALAMKAVPDVNASWMETKVRVYDRCDINVVVGVGDGMAAPVLLDVGSKGLKTISDEVSNALECDPSS